MNDLQHLARKYHLSIESLRHFAFTSCRIPQDAPQDLVDQWLYERLAIRENTMLCNINPHNELDLRRAFGYTLSGSESSNSFEERCAASWAELVANPIVRHEITLHEPFSWGPLPVPNGPERVIAENEMFCDSIVVLNALIETASQAQTDPA
jgi:hypothetical protein